MVVRGPALTCVLAALTLAAAPAALAQDDVPAAPTSLADAAGVEVAGSELLGPGQEGIGPLASAPQSTRPDQEGATDEPAATPSEAAAPAAASKPAAKATHRPPVRSARKARPRHTS